MRMFGSLMIACLLTLVAACDYSEEVNYYGPEAGDTAQQDVSSVSDTGFVPDVASDVATKPDFGPEPDVMQSETCVEQTYYFDNDNDGFGWGPSAVTACEPPGKLYVTQGGDCDDFAAHISPGAPEVCDGLDNDCDGLGDLEDPDLIGSIEQGFIDNDGDGYGGEQTTQACWRVEPKSSTGYPDWFALEGGDCDDSDFTTNPGADELCDTIDHNCSGDPTDDLLVPTYLDKDGDGFGVGEIKYMCGYGGEYVPVAGDCNDQNESAYPGAPEVCDGVDNNCDGQVDVGAIDATTWYADNDGDGQGNLWFWKMSCTQPDGYVGNAYDCNDNDTSVFMHATEYCDNKDNDCDGVTDENVKVELFIDNDKDGYGTNNPLVGKVMACPGTPGASKVAGDCNDFNKWISPEANETCDEFDNDCDGKTDEGLLVAVFYDNDGDGFGDGPEAVQVCPEKIPGHALVPGDCNPLRADVYPGAPEVCDNADNDCDGNTDEGAADAMAWFPDDDGDGYGDQEAAPLSDCGPPQAGYVDNNQDCDDAQFHVNPDTIEYCLRDPDDNCDGQKDWQQECVDEGHYDGWIHMEFQWADSGEEFECVGDDFSGNSVIFDEGAGIVLSGVCSGPGTGDGVGGGGYIVHVEGQIVEDDDGYRIHEGTVAIKDSSEFHLEWAGVFHASDFFSGGTSLVQEVQTTELGGGDVHVRMSLHANFVGPF